MLLFIEGYPYNLSDTVRDNLTVRHILKDVVSIPTNEDKYSFGYVGYCYSKAAQDVVFFLPKVVLTGELNEESVEDTIFGASPRDIIDFESDKVKSKFTETGCNAYKDFISTLSIWIYRTISVYKQTHNDDINILESKKHLEQSWGKKQKYNTLLDVILALKEFNKNNQDYFTFIVKNIHSGYNKIHWNKTIVSSKNIIQKGRPIYIKPVNRKRMVNFDEELLVIYFSILNYIRKEYGFSFEINFRYQLINPVKLRQSYIETKKGCQRLKQIKYKYFSDKALMMWDLCYAFFDREYKIAMNKLSEDLLLAKDFEYIFEAMIDSLICGNDKKDLPKELTEQRDGKLVDHMFVGQGLIEKSDLPAELTYYIGDSKYYKRYTEIGDQSIYKQYTYARNVIQWNMNLFLDGKDNGDQPQLRDTLTEGYNPIPNFFISARIPNKETGGEAFLSFGDKKLKAHNKIQINRQFENRLFDRDTLLLCHYNVNFLYIVSLYGRDNKSAQTRWREYVRKEFRKKIQDTLTELYTFITLQPRKGMDCYQFIQDNFQRLNGKIYRPKTDNNHLILALMNEKSPHKWAYLGINQDTFNKEISHNKELLKLLQTHFYVSAPFKLGTEPKMEILNNVGTLDKLQKNDINNILTGFVRTSDKDYDIFSKHLSKEYTMEKIPTYINVMDIEYFLPMVGGVIDGYYKVEKVYFGNKNGKLSLKLNLSTYISLGEKKVQIYRNKMQPGELISYDLMMKLYE